MAYKRSYWAYRGGFKYRGRKMRRYRGKYKGKSGRFLARRRRHVVPALLPESKYVDAFFGNGTATNGLSLTSNVTVLDMNGPATAAADSNAGGAGVVGIAGGSGFNQRIGRKVFLKYMSIRIRVIPYTIATVTPLIQQFRFILLYDRQPNLALPANTDVLNINTGLTTITFMEDRNRDRFVRLWDYTGYCSYGGASQPNDLGMALVNKLVKIGGIQVYNDTANGGVANIQTGSLILVYMGDPQAAAQANGLYAELAFRLRYSDL